MTALSPEKLDELERLEAEATAGPWRVIHGNEVVGGANRELCSGKEDAALIAAMRNALPALLVSARELAAVKAKYECEYCCSGGANTDDACGCMGLCINSGDEHQREIHGPTARAALAEQQLATVTAERDEAIAKRDEDTEVCGGYIFKLNAIRIALREAGISIAGQSLGDYAGIVTAVRDALAKLAAAEAERDKLRVLSAAMFAADYEQSAEEAEAELRADGVDVDAFTKRVREQVAKFKGTSANTNAPVTAKAEVCGVQVCTPTCAELLIAEPSPLAAQLAEAVRLLRTITAHPCPCRNYAAVDAFLSRLASDGGGT